MVPVRQRLHIRIFSDPSPKSRSRLCGVRAISWTSGTYCLEVESRSGVATTKRPAIIISSLVEPSWLVCWPPPAANDGPALAGASILCPQRALFPSPDALRSFPCTLRSAAANQCPSESPSCRYTRCLDSHAGQGIFRLFLSARFNQIDTREHLHDPSLSPAYKRRSSARTCVCPRTFVPIRIQWRISAVVVGRVLSNMSP